MTPRSKSPFPPEITLGATCEWSAELKRGSAYNVSASDWDRVWTPYNTETKLGIVVGVRTLANGHVDYDPDEGHTWKHGEAVHAVLVAWNLHRKPVLVAVADLKILHGPLPPPAPPIDERQIPLWPGSRTVWNKTCGCHPATASFGQLRTRQVHDPATDSMTIVSAYYPQPSCDKCGTPWEQPIDSA